MVYGAFLAEGQRPGPKKAERIVSALSVLHLDVATLCMITSAIIIRICYDIIHRNVNSDSVYFVFSTTDGRQPPLPYRRKWETRAVDGKNENRPTTAFIGQALQNISRLAKYLEMV